MKNHFRRLGYSLFEMLAVVGIMAAVGGIAVVNYTDVENHQMHKISEVGLEDLKKAIIAFKNDTDYYPKKGKASMTCHGGPIDYLKDEHWPEHMAGTTPPQKIAYFISPYYFADQLINNPWKIRSGPDKGKSFHPLADFNPDTGKGWNGPYLDEGSVAYLKSNAFVYGVGNPLEPNHYPGTGYTIWTLAVPSAIEHPPHSNGLMAWNLEVNGGSDTAFLKRGRAILYSSLGAHNGLPGVSEKSVPGIRLGVLLGSNEDLSKLPDITDADMMILDVNHN